MKKAKIKIQDGSSLEVRLFPNGLIEIEPLQGIPSIQITLANSETYPCSEEAVYEISVYRSKPNSKEILNGDIYTIYVGKNGFILNNAARERATKLYQKTA